MVQKEVCPRDEIADFPGTNMLLIDRQGFAEGFVSFCTLGVVYSAAVRFAPNRAIVWDPLEQRQAPGETLCFRLAIS